MDMTSNQGGKEFHVVTSLGFHSNFDGEPINNALHSNLFNKRITRIHVLTESPLDLLKECLPALNDERVNMISVNQRPSFKDLFDFCNNLTIDLELVVSLMNADTSFEGDGDIELCLATLEVCRQRGQNAMLTISRHDKRGEQFGLFLRDKIGLPNFVSADCWVFCPPLTPIDIDFFFMGQLNCDLMLTHTLAESGYLLLNPCVDISVIHHEALEKTEEFYAKQNLNKTALDIINWHWSKRCIVPYHYYGVIWNRIKWIEQGYLPAPIKNSEKKKIYLFVSGTFVEKIDQQILFFTEIICRCNELDLIVMGENIYEVSDDLIGKIGLVSRNTYFVQVDSLDEVYSNLNNLHESIAWISNLGLLTPTLVKEFHSVIFDIRYFDRVMPVEVPSGHTDLRAIIIGRYEIEVDEKFIFEPLFTQHSSCTLITSIYKSDLFIQGFHENITALDGYKNHVHVILCSQLSKLEQEVLISWRAKYSNLILGWFNKDPGLYECWNIGIRLARTEFVSNANVDDLRHPAHVDTLLKCLRSRSDVAVASSAIIAFENYTSRLEDIDESQPWYVDEAGEFGMDKLAKLKRDDHGRWMLVPHNIPHCMPVWRKVLHEKYGYFDETRFGTFADWAFWLKVTKSGEKGFLDARALSYYFINVSSHNRRGDKLKQFHDEVEREFLDAFYFRKIMNTNSLLHLSSVNSVCPSPNRELPRKLHLTGLSQSFGEHRNSFNRLIESLLPLHNEQGGLEFIPFIERYFVWGDDDGEARSSNPRPIEKEWIGMLHVPFDAPKWFEHTVNPEAIFNTKLWKSSLSYCRGIICLSEDLRLDLTCWYPEIPSFSLKFPTVLNVKPFDLAAYQRRPRLVQAGDWLRHLQGIYEVTAPGHEKIMLMKSCTAEFLRREIEAIGDLRDNSVNVLDMVSAEEYDDLLGSSVVLCLLYATAANNIVTECIARKTPILINPLPSVIEYLGVEYPLYVNNIEEASIALTDINRIRAAYEYLDDQVFLRETLSYQNFANSIGSSSFYANL